MLWSYCHGNLLLTISQTGDIIKEYPQGDIHSDVKF